MDVLVSLNPVCWQTRRSKFMAKGEEGQLLSKILYVLSGISLIPITVQSFMF